jgi:hypothetical protein
MSVSNDILPAFAIDPNIEAARALSEYFLQRDSFVTSPRADMPVTAPEDLRLLSCYVAYRDQAREGVIVRQLYVSDDENAPLPTIAAQFVGRYQTEVSSTQRDVINAGSAAFYEHVVESLVVPSVECAKKDELRTVAGFALFQSGDFERFYHNFFIPRKTYEEVPLLFRQTILNMLQAIEGTGITRDRLFKDSDNKLFHEMMQNGASNRDMAFHAAALHMPRAQVVARQFAQIIIANRAVGD